MILRIVSNSCKVRMSFRLLACAMISVIYLSYSSLAKGEDVKDIKDIVYIEASTAKAWKLDSFPERVKTNRYKVDLMRVYEFDKSGLVDKALDKKRSKPDAVVVQECAVYFPGDMEHYKIKYKGWVKQIKKSGSRPIIATVVPPAPKSGYMVQVKELIKIYILGRPKQYDQVIEFNDWLRQLATKENVSLLDLEKVVRVSEEDRHMKNEYDTGDGIHINRSAYNQLDEVFLKVLEDMDWK